MRAERMKDLSRTCRAWPTEPLERRLLGCLTMLLINGVLTDGDHRKAKRRLYKQLEQLKCRT